MNFNPFTVDLTLFIIIIAKIVSKWNVPEILNINHDTLLIISDLIIFQHGIFQRSTHRNQQQGI